MNEAKKLVPKLRFPEFRGSTGWSLTPLGLACQMQAGKYVSASEIREQNGQGRYPCYGGNGLRGYTVTFTHSGKYSLIGRQGALCGNVKKGIGQFHATEHAIVVTPTKGVNGDWLFFILDFLNLNRFATGQAQPGLSVDVLEKLQIAVPSRETEQQEIADCLSSLDDLIAAQARKVDKLRTHKNGLMQQLFPRESETQPRLRFPEFRDAPEWENALLGNVFDTTSGGTPSRLEAGYWDGDIPWITTSLVNFEVITEAEQFISQDGLIHSSAKLLPPGTVLIAMYGQGKTRGQVALLGVEAATNQACAAVLPKAGINPYFLFVNFAGRYDEFRRLSNSGGQENLSQALIRDLTFAYPVDEREQGRIADCLTSLETLSAAATQELEALQTHKKGLMQQLFPSAESVKA